MRIGDYVHPFRVRRGLCAVVIVPVPMGQTKESHYAVFPPALIERPIAMTCPLEVTAQGPKRRIVEMVPYEEARPIQRGIGKYSKPEEETRIKSGRQDTGRQYIPRKPVTVGW